MWTFLGRRLPAPAGTAVAPRSHGLAHTPTGSHKCASPREGLWITRRTSRRPPAARGALLYVAAAMDDLPQPDKPATQWLDDAHTARERGAP